MNGNLVFCGPTSLSSYMSLCTSCPIQKVLLLLNWNYGLRREILLVIPVHVIFGGHENDWPTLLGDFRGTDGLKSFCEVYCGPTMNLLPGLPWRDLPNCAL